MDGTLIFFGIIVVISLVAWIIRESSRSDARQADQESVESISNVEITYDKFGGETTLMYGSRLSREGPPYPNFVIMAFHKGAAVPPGGKPTNIIVMVGSGRNSALNSIAPIVLLIDGRRVELGKVTGPNPSPCSRGFISLSDLEAISRASSAEAQAGVFEFTFKSDHKARIGKIVAYFGRGARAA